MRWKSPVYADLTIFPRVEVVEANDKQVKFAINVTLESGAAAMTGEVTVPLV